MAKKVTLTSTLARLTLESVHLLVRWALGASLVLGLGLTLCAPSVAAPAAIMPLSQVEPGMEGYGLTVFQGTKPEPFKVRVVAVLRNFMPKQSIVLVRVEDPRVEHTGVAAGMSGSPIYIDGKVMGALAYAWAFSKDPLAGVTPIESMLEDSRRPLRDMLKPTPLAAGVAQPVLGQPQLVPVSVPLAFSGVPPHVFEDVREDLRAMGLVPVSAAGGGGSGRVDTPAFEPGGAVAVELVRGDMAVNATGTITYVDGNKVLAFGHPMIRAGRVSLPMVGAEIHAIMPSLANAFKLASPLGEVGTLVQDRGTGIMGVLGQKADRVPLTINVGRANEPVQPFRVEIAKHDTLTPMMVSIVTASAIAISESDPVDMVVDLVTKFSLAGASPIELRDQAFSTGGLTPRLISATHGFRALQQVLDNPFGRVDLQRLEVSAQVSYKRDTLEVVGVQLAQRPVLAGKPLSLRVLLRPFGGQDIWRTITVDMPAGLQGRTVEIEVASGAAVAPDKAKPESLKDLLAQLGAHHTAGQLVVSVALPETGASLRGAALGPLPPSAIDTLWPANQSRRAQLQRMFGRTVIESPQIVLGKASLKIQVDADALGRNG